MRATSELTSAPWRIAGPADAQAWLADLDLPWWIAGGWAIDLFLGSATRPHKDLDVGIFRRDAPAVIALLRDWEIFEAKDGTLRRLREGESPSGDVNSLWCRQRHSTEWSLELLLDDRTDEHWVFRRRPEITRPVAEIFRRGVDGVSYLAPEIQLLYKAKALRPQDQDDFERVLPYLELETAKWRIHLLDRAHAESICGLTIGKSSRTRQSVVGRGTYGKFDARVTGDGAR